MICQQIATIAEESYRTDSNFTKTPVNKISQFSYDANGNLLSINTGTKSGDKLLVTNSRKLLWDEDNRLLASNDNGFVTSYFYDAGGERTVKMSGDGEGVQVNGVLSGIRNGTTNFTAYISPYLIVRNGGEYTKHIYMGGQRIVSKVSDSGIFNISPVNTNDLQAKYTAQTASLKARYDSLGVMYKGVQQTGGLISKSPTVSSSSYFYHSDHLGSSSLITDANGELVQHIEYVPYGETFIDERRSASSWTTPYLFSGKERDEETGLLYVSQRYQDGKYCIWYSVDLLALKYPNIGSYVYCAGNPIKYVDLDGNSWTPVDKNGKSVSINDKEKINSYNWVDYDTDEKGHKIARPNTVETAYTFGEKGMTTLSSEGYTRHETWQAYGDISTGDKQADKNIASLDPRIQDQMKSVVLMARLRYGIDVRGGQQGGFRTYDEQDKIFARGASKAKGGQSNHNFALAMDAAIYENGKYLSKGSEWQYKAYGDIAKKRGLMWGGDWKSFFDPAHIEYKHNLTMQQLRALPKDKNGYLIKLP
jgi:RHS repeat-associated protein